MSGHGRVARLLRINSHYFSLSVFSPSLFHRPRMYRFIASGLPSILLKLRRLQRRSHRLLES